MKRCKIEEDVLNNVLSRCIAQVSVRVASQVLKALRSRVDVAAKARMCSIDNRARSTRERPGLQLQLFVEPI